MRTSEVFEAIDRTRLVPVVVIDDAAAAVAVANALMPGGITCAEITLRTGGGFRRHRCSSDGAGFHRGSRNSFQPKAGETMC